jgi:hypothetical protein
VLPLLQVKAVKVVLKNEVLGTGRVLCIVCISVCDFFEVVVELLSYFLDVDGFAGCGQKTCEKSLTHDLNLNLN